MSRFESLRLRDVLEPVSRMERVGPDQTCRTLGVRWYGAGCFVKAAGPVKARALNVVRAGDVVYSKLFAWKGSFGVVGEQMDGVFASTEFPTFRPDETRLLPAYFELWAGRPEVWAAADDLSTGTTGNSRNRLSPEDFLDLEIDLPPIDEQRAGVASVRLLERGALSWSVESNASFVALSALREELLAAVAETSEAVSVSEVLLGLRTGQSPRCEARRPRAGETGVLKLSAIRPGEFNPTEAKALPDATAVPDECWLAGGEILMTRSNTLDRVGAACRVPAEVANRLVYPDLVYRLTPAEDRIVPNYLVEVLATRDLRDQIQMSATGTSDSMKKISASIVRALEIPLPSVPDQEEIVRKLATLRRSAVLARSEATRLERLKTAFVEEMVSGERPLRRPTEAVA